MVGKSIAKIYTTRDKHTIRILYIYRGYRPIYLLYILYSTVSVQPTNLLPVYITYRIIGQQPRNCVPIYSCAITVLY